MMRDSLRRMRPLAARLREEHGFDEETPVEPEGFFERHFPVVCLTVPGLCIAAARHCLRRRWRGESQAAADTILQATDGADVYDPLRGVCIAFRGCGLLLADEKDSREEQRFTFAHEGAHFLLDCHLPRQKALNKLGEGIRAVLDGARPPSVAERFDSVVRCAPLTWRTHLYPREEDSPLLRDGAILAETDADALACLLMAPPLACITGGEQTPFAGQPLPPRLAASYAAALRREAAPPGDSLLERLGLTAVFERR